MSGMSHNAMIIFVLEGWQQSRPSRLDIEIPRRRRRSVLDMDTVVGPRRLL